MLKALSLYGIHHFVTVFSPDTAQKAISPVFIESKRPESQDFAEIISYEKFMFSIISPNGFMRIAFDFSDFEVSRKTRKEPSFIS